MKNILLVYLPFCTPAAPPYSITRLYSFLKKNCRENIDAIDLNIEFHRLKFPEHQKYYRDSSKWADYDKKTKEYREISSKIYRENNRGFVDGKKPEFFDMFLEKINEKKPDIVAFSIVYSSQVFYALALMKELKVPVILGGPAVNEKISPAAAKVLNNEVEMLEFIEGKKIRKESLDFDFSPDFSIYNLDEYFTPETVIPVKTSNSCYYRKCAFCTHYNREAYCEYPIERIKNDIISSGKKHFFLIDDMIPAKRLLQLAEMIKPLNATWTCQLKPTKEFTPDALKKLKESGMKMIMWGMESASDRLLKLMSKATNIKDIESVLKDSHDAGIKNIVYILFGFPTETKEELLETLEFMKKNEKSIDLVSTSIFGLQKGTEVYNNPEKFGITKISGLERTMLEPKITYEASEGLSQEAAEKLRKSYKRTIEKINKYPKTMNFFREHMLCIV